VSFHRVLDITPITEVIRRARRKERLERWAAWATVLSLPIALLALTVSIYAIMH
jgi:hypothetical protein